MECLKIALCGSLHHTAAGQSITDDNSIGELLQKFLHDFAVRFGSKRQDGEVTIDMDRLAICQLLMLPSVDGKSPG